MVMPPKATLYVFSKIGTIKASAQVYLRLGLVCFRLFGSIKLSRSALGAEGLAFQEALGRQQLGHPCPEHGRSPGSCGHCSYLSTYHCDCGNPVDYRFRPGTTASSRK
jgi:hypothetical protein